MFRILLLPWCCVIFFHKTHGDRWERCLLTSSHSLLRRIVRSQQNIDSPYNLTYCKDDLDDWGEKPECPIPQFAGGFPQVRVSSVTDYVMRSFHLDLVRLLVSCQISREMVLKIQTLTMCQTDLDVGDWSHGDLLV